MSPGKHEDCEHCEDHMAREEKLKALDCIPILMTFMNQELGSKKTTKYLIGLFISIPFLLLLSLIAKTQADINEVKSATYQQIQTITTNTAKISQDVAVMVNTFSMAQSQARQEHESIRRDIVATQNQINMDKNSGKK